METLSHDSHDMSILFELTGDFFTGSELDSLHESCAQTACEHSRRGTIAPSPLDLRTAADIPAEKRAADLPQHVVAIVGNPRGRHAGEVRGVTVSADGKLIATISDQDIKIRLWDAATLRPLAALAGNWGFVHCVAISADGH